MPEIAEVETVRNVLKKRILNKRIKDVDIYYSKIIENNIDDFKKILIGNEFHDILRRGKWLIFELDKHYLLSHLRMEGKYFIKNHDEEHVKHEHIVIEFYDNTDLRYHDTRKFGRMKLVNKEDLDNTIEIQKQGKEPMDNTLTTDYLLSKFKGKTMPIKTSLLDQEIISGLGNIYADEVLYASGINPRRKTNTITKNECDKIIKSSKQIILKAIEEGGTTIKSYTSSLGVTGNYQSFLNVHKREGLPCKKCNTLIKRIKIGGRSTYYCDNCQK
jgi:formamidopyrimidine-DNA glycosylase